jgi:MADS-box transcription factor
MKKAWELSVLCGADVSILIFSAAGKPYEFSSADLDGEMDRYNDVSFALAAFIHS